MAVDRVAEIPGTAYMEGRDPVFGLDADLNLVGIISPCPAKTQAVLNVDKPTWVSCGCEEGHDGPHYFHIEWGQK